MNEMKKEFLPQILPWPNPFKRSMDERALWNLLFSVTSDNAERNIKRCLLKSTDISLQKMTGSKLKLRHRSGLKGVPEGHY